MLIATIAGGGLSTTRPCVAQQPGVARRPGWADSTPPQIMKLARGGFPDDIVIEVLRQRHQAYPAAKRRELADSVVALALRVPGAADAAVSAIAESGSAE